MKRNGETHRTISKKKLLNFDERKKILNNLSIFGSSKNSMLIRYDSAEFLYAEFSSKIMPFSILLKSLNLIIEIYSSSYKQNLIWPATKILHGIVLLQKNQKALNLVIADVRLFFRVYTGSETLLSFAFPSYY